VFLDLELSVVYDYPQYPLHYRRQSRISLFL